MPLFKLVKKKNFLSISVLLSAIVTFFYLKENFSVNFTENASKQRGKHSLAVCSSFWGEIQFLLIFVLFYWFDQKKLFKQIQFFLRICAISNLLRKTNFLSISVLLSEIVTFLNKKRSFQWISPKMLQNNRKLWFSCMWHILSRKIVFVSICPLLLVWSKKLFKQIQFFLRI